MSEGTVHTVSKASDTKSQIQVLKDMRKVPGISAAAKKQFDAQIAALEGKGKSKPKSPTKKAPKPAAKPAKKAAPKKATKPAAKKAAPKAAPKKAPAKKPTAKPAAKPAAKTTAPKKAAKKPAAKPAPKKAAPKKPAAKAAPKKPAAKKANVPPKGVVPPGLAAYQAAKKAAAAAAAKPAAPKTPPTPSTESSNTPMAKPAAKKKPAKKTAARAAAPTAKKKGGTAKKAAKKPTKKAAPPPAATQTSAPAKPAAKKPAKKAAKKPAAKKPAAKKAAPKKPTQKAAPKKAAKKATKKHTKKAHHAVKRSQSITFSGKKSPKSVQRAKKGKHAVRRTTTYSGRTGKLTVTQTFLRAANPVNDMGRLGLLALGMLAGTVGVDVLDRFIATRAGDAKYPWYSHDAARRIMTRPDGVRIGAQAAFVVASGALAVGAYKYKMPIAATIFAGVAIGGAVKTAADLLRTRVMPLLFSVEKGNERSVGNRLYPLEQDALQTEEEKKIEAQNKDWKSAPSQGGTDELLPAEFLFKPAAAAPSTGTGGYRNPLAGTRIVPRVGEPQTAPRALPQPQPQMRMEPAARPAAPAARPVQAPKPIRTAPVNAVPASDVDCPNCDSKGNMERDGIVEAGMNVRPVVETIAPGVQTEPEAPPFRQGSPAAQTRTPQRADGRPRGTGRIMPGATAALAGAPAGAPAPKSNMRSNFGRN